jgi:ribose transport system ATP-binding protein
MDRAQVVLRVRDVRVRPDAPPLDATVARGEILGVAGLDGQGQEDFLEILCGLRKPAGGEVLAGTAGGMERVRSYHGAARAGIVYLPRDRKSEGILPSLSVLDNFAIALLDQSQRAGFLRWRQLRATYDAFRARLSIVARSPSAPITSLSGGNQQKVLLARWMATRPRVMVLNDPTRGVDLATRLSIHDALRDLAAERTAIILLSTEIEELVQLCHRVLVFREGHVFSELARADITMAAIVGAMFGRQDGRD